MDEEQYQIAKNFVEKLLAQHPRTIWEIKTKLAQKKFAQEIVGQLVKEFIDAGFLNDEKYIRLWLENQIKYRPCGRSLCLKKLLSRGLEFNSVNNILSEVLTEEKELEIAEELIKRKINFYRDLSQQKKFTKIASFLKSRGFGDNIIIKILEKLKLENLDSNF